MKINKSDKMATKSLILGQRILAKNKIFHSQSEIKRGNLKSTFEGMHPTLRQVPPRVAFFSMQTVFIPS